MIDAVLVLEENVSASWSNRIDQEREAVLSTNWAPMHRTTIWAASKPVRSRSKNVDIETQFYVERRSFNCFER
jgi:hypothetical protein